MAFKQNLSVCGADSIHWVRTLLQISQSLSLTLKFVPQVEHDIIEHEPVLLGLSTTST